MHAIIINTPIYKPRVYMNIAYNKPLNKPLFGKKKKKSKRIYLIIALFAIVIMIVAPTLATGDSEALQEIEDKISGNVDAKLSEIDLSELESFVDGLNMEGTSLGGGVATFIKAVINGEYNGGYNDFFKAAMASMGKGMLDILPIILTIVAIAILYSIMSGLTSGFSNKSTIEIIYFVCYSAIIIILVTKITQLIGETVNTIKIMKKLMDISFPILLTMMTALGGAISVATYQPMMAVVSTGVVSIINAVILPCFIATVVLSVVGSLSKNIKLDKLNKFFKSVGEYILGIVFSLFMTFVTLQGITGAIADNISIKSAKFAISSYVPILGGYLSEGFDLILASVVLIKNSLGLTGVFVMLGVVLMPIIKITILSLGLKLASGIIEPIGDKRMSDIVYSMSSNLILLTVALLAVAFMFFVMMMLVIYTCNTI